MTGFFGADKKGFFTIYAISLFAIISCSMMLISARMHTLVRIASSDRKLLYCEMFTLHQVTKELNKQQDEEIASIEEREEEPKENPVIQQWSYEDCLVKVQFHDSIQATLHAGGRKRRMQIVFDEAAGSIMDIVYE